MANEPFEDYRDHDREMAWDRVLSNSGPQHGESLDDAIENELDVMAGEWSRRHPW